MMQRFFATEAMELSNWQTLISYIQKHGESRSSNLNEKAGQADDEKC